MSAVEDAARRVRSADLLLWQRQFGNAIAVGDSWETVFVGEKQVAEFFLQGDSSFGSRAIGLGYNTALDARDLTFSYTSADGLQLNGNCALRANCGSVGRRHDGTRTDGYGNFGWAIICGLAGRRR